MIPTSFPDGHVYFAIYNIESIVRLQAILGICQTVTVCILLGFSSFFFSRITSKLVIEPLENMIERVNNITKDPIGAV